MAYDQSHVHSAENSTQMPSYNDHYHNPGTGHRETSNAHAATMTPDHTRYSPPHQVNAAVTSAFDRAGAETSNYAPPELIAQITQNVIKQLQSQSAGALASSTPIPPRNSFSPPPVQQPVPLSPSTASGASTNMPNRVYTPPSPQKTSEYHPQTSPPTQPGFPLDTPRSPREHKSAHFSPPRRSPSPQSHQSDSSDKPYTRPKGPSRLSTSKEETTLEKIWGQLFDEDSNPTVRLGQFLRGLAVHIIEDYEPRHSLVITPNKMVKYYEDVKLVHELYPWSTVFDDERSSISRMFRDLGCQHHLVQEQYDQRPDIPGLTPVGFERWVTLLIQAHPEEEFERLQKAVLEMPISNPDDKKERFPKEISRRLFPGHEDRRIRNIIEDAISEHAAVEIPRRSSQEEPQPSRDHPKKACDPGQTVVQPSHRASVSFDLPPASSLNTTSTAPQLERERKPYSSIPTESAIDDMNPPLPLPSNPIERERKPYSALPGGGKQYDEDDSKPRDSTKPRSDSVASSAPKISRSDSTARSRPIPIGNSRPMEVPRTEVHHHRAPSNAGRRRRSPSFNRGMANDFRRSDGDIRSYNPSSYQPPASVSVGPPPVESVFDENDTRRYFERSARERAERARRQAEDDARIYGESPRRYDRTSPDDRAPLRRGDFLNDEDYYRAGGRGGNGYDYAQPYGGPIHR